MINTIIYIIIFPGDLFDEGEWSNDKQFMEYVDRFHQLFSVPSDTQMHVVAGNHDIGFHHKWSIILISKTLYNVKKLWMLNTANSLMYVCILKIEKNTLIYFLLNIV